MGCDASDWSGASAASVSGADRHVRPVKIECSNANAPGCPSPRATPHRRGMPRVTLDHRQVTRQQRLQTPIPVQAGYFPKFVASFLDAPNGFTPAVAGGAGWLPRFWRAGAPHGGDRIGGGGLGAAFAYRSARAMTLPTVAGCQAPPRADLMPRASSAAAMPASDATPDDRTLSMIGMTLSVGRQPAP